MASIRSYIKYNLIPMKRRLRDAAWQLGLKEIAFEEDGWFFKTIRFEYEGEPEAVRQLLEWLQGLDRLYREKSSPTKTI